MTKNYRLYFWVLFWIINCVMPAQAAPVFANVTGSVPLHSTKHFKVEEAGDQETASNVYSILIGEKERINRQHPKIDYVYDRLADDDNWQSGISNAAYGKICYGVGGHLRFGIVVLDAAKSHDGNIVAKTYIMNAVSLTAFQPRFSPDGRYIAFILGWPAEFFLNTRIYVLDTETDRLTDISGSHRYITSYQWAADGSGLAFTADAINYEGKWTGNMSLVTYNFKAKLDTLVGTAGGSQRFLLGYYCVTPDHVLFTSDIDYLSHKKFSAQDNGKPIRTGIYEWTGRSKITHLLVADAKTPVVSPDGKLVAFISLRISAEAFRENAGRTRVPGGRPVAAVPTPVLAVIKINGSGLKELNPYIGCPPPILWRGDSKHVLAFGISEVTEHNRPKYWKAVVISWDSTTGRHEELGSFQANQYARAEMGFYMYGPCHLSDAEWFNPLSLQDTGDRDASIICRIYSSYEASGGVFIKSLNLSTKNITELVHAPSYVDFDWWSGPDMRSR